MALFKRRPTVDPGTFCRFLAAQLFDAAVARGSTDQPTGPLPGNPWARRVIVALHTHTVRQRWVAKVLREQIHADPLAIAKGGHPGIPAGQVPGLPGWRFYFHGIGCCLTHENGTVLDVDFDEHGADGIDPYFYTKYLDSLPNATGVEASLRRPKPLDDWWMAEIECLRRLEWLEGDRVRVTSMGNEWAITLRPAFRVITEEQDASRRLRAALIIEDFPWAAEMEAAPSEVRQRAERCAALRATELERNLRRGRARHTFAGLAVHDSERATRLAERALVRGPLDGLTSLELDYLQSREPGPAVELLLRLAQRAKGTAPPAPRLRTEAVVGILKRYRSDSLPQELRVQVLDVLLPEAHAGEGLSALLQTLLDYERGLERLARALGHSVPLARAEAAAALALLGTPEAAEVLRRGGSAVEAKAALALLRGFSPEPGPNPEGHIIEVQGRPQRVYMISELVAADCPAYVRLTLEWLAKDLGPLLERWWAQ